MGLILYSNCVFLLHSYTHKENRNDFNISLNSFFHLKISFKFSYLSTIYEVAVLYHRKAFYGTYWCTMGLDSGILPVLFRIRLRFPPEQKRNNLEFPAGTKSEFRMVPGRSRNFRSCGPEAKNRKVQLRHTDS